MKTKHYESIDLLNSEGAILKTFKTPIGFLILDQYKEIIALKNKSELMDFIFNDEPIIDSIGTVIYYKEKDDGMKQNIDVLSKFIWVD
jgi:hypothetical protein